MIEKKTGLIQKPQINISFQSKWRMWLVFFCALLCVFQSAYTDSGLSLILAAVSLFTALVLELLLTVKKYNFEKIKDGSAAATALVFTLLLPNQIHPLYAVFGVIFAIVVVKFSFGGLGSNWLNPALGGWLFIRFTWPVVFTSALEGSPSSYINISQMQLSAGRTSYDGITTFFNNTIFSVTGAELPFGYIDLLFSNNPGIIADRGLFALLIGTIILMALKISRRWVPVVFLLIFVFMISFAGGLKYDGMYWSGDILFGLFTGGTIAAAFILASDPATGAKTSPGILIIIIVGAVLSWIFRYQSLEYGGCFIAFALVNCLTPVIRLIERKMFFSRNGKLAEG